MSQNGYEIGNVFLLETVGYQSVNLFTTALVSIMQESIKYRAVHDHKKLLCTFEYIMIFFFSFQTILLRDKQQQDYCVACSELDTEHAKDDPGEDSTTPTFSFILFICGRKYSIWITLRGHFPVSISFDSRSIFWQLESHFIHRFLINYFGYIHTCMQHVPFSF